MMGNSGRALRWERLEDVLLEVSALHPPGLKTSLPLGILEAGSPTKHILIQSWTISLALVSKVILGESEEKMTKLGWLLYLFGWECSVGSDPVLLFLADWRTEEDSKQWGTLCSGLFASWCPSLPATPDPSASL